MGMAALGTIGKIAAPLLGGLFGKKREQAVTQGAQQRSPEELRALTGAQGAAGGLASTGAGLTATGQATQQPATNYFSTLLRGNRAAQTQAVAAPTAAVQDIYRGAERGLERSGVRGAQRDVASAELGRERASKIAGLVTGVQPGAAQALTGIGQTQTQQGLAATQAGGSLYGGLLGQGAQSRQLGQQVGREAGAETGKNVGGFIFDLISGFGGRKKKAPGPWAGGYQF